MQNRVALSFFPHGASAPIKCRQGFPLIAPAWRRTLAILALVAPLLASAWTEHAPPWTDLDPVVTSWRLPDYPEALASERREGDVIVRFVVDDLGKVVEAQVTKSFDARADQSALEDIRGWTFKPSMVAAHSAYSCLDVDIPFRLGAAPADLSQPPPAAERPLAVKKVPPVVISKPDPIYPPELATQQQGGVVTLLLWVDNHGKVAGSRLLNAANPLLVPSAADAVNLWTFKPSLQGRIVVPCLVEVDVIFSPR
jgi:TonB family protein